MSWYAARDYCSNIAGTQLATFQNVNQLASRATLASNHNLYHTTAMWNGLRDSGGENNINDYIWVGTNYTLNLTSSYYSLRPSRDCGCFVPNRSEIYDWHCNDSSSNLKNGPNTYTVCDAFICNKPETRNYTITIDLNEASHSQTDATIWFRIKGMIEDVEELDMWTDWFTKNDFNQPGDNYTWNVSLINVGPPISIIILTDHFDGIYVDSVAVDDQSITLDTFINIRYIPGMYCSAYLYLIIIHMC